MKAQKLLSVMIILVLLLALPPVAGVQAGKGSDGKGNGATIQSNQSQGQGIHSNVGKKDHPKKFSMLEEEGPLGKVDVCHRRGNGTFIMININEHALPAHLAHGDALPGVVDPENPEQMVDGECNAVEVTRYESPAMGFGPMGWGGWSCPADTMVVGGGYEPAELDVLYSGAAKPGAVTTTTPQYTYPVYPHYTFTPPETGWVVQNINTGQELSVYVLCAPIVPEP